LTETSQIALPGADRIEFPSAATDPRFRTFFDYWRSKAPPGLLPGRQHIDPVEMRAFLPYILLFDVVRLQDGRYRFRHRLVGTHVSLLLSAIRPLSFVDEIAYPEHYEKLHYPEMVRIIERHEAHYSQREVPVMVRNFTQFQRLKLPMATDGITVDMVIGLYIGLPVEAKKPPRDRFLR
jgi:hypothetical protein